MPIDTTESPESPDFSHLPDNTKKIFQSIAFEEKINQRFVDIHTKAIEKPDLLFEEIKSNLDTLRNHQIEFSSAEQSEPYHKTLLEIQSLFDEDISEEFINSGYSVGMLGSNIYADQDDEKIADLDFVVCYDSDKSSLQADDELEDLFDPIYDLWQANIASHIASKNFMTVSIRSIPLAMHTLKSLYEGVDMPLMEIHEALMVINVAARFLSSKSMCDDGELREKLTNTLYENITENPLALARIAINTEYTLQKRLERKGEQIDPSKKILIIGYDD